MYGLYCYSGNWQYATILREKENGFSEVLLYNGKIILVDKPVLAEKFRPYPADELKDIENFKRLIINECRLKENRYYG